MASFPDPFTVSSETVIPVLHWYFLLTQNHRAYDNYVVRTLTHVKNLRSSVVHEYLQIIVERTDITDPNKNRTRIIAERQVLQDQVILGRKSWAAFESSESLLSSLVKISLGSSISSSGDGGSLPLPLYSLKFNSGDFKLADLVEILMRTGNGSCYNPFTTNCYWFAKVVFDTAMTRFRCTQEAWQFGWWRGALITGDRRPAELKAEEFVERIQSDMEYAPGVRDAFQLWLEGIYADAIRLNCDDEVDAQVAINNHLSELVSKDLDQGITIRSLEEPKAEASTENALETLCKEADAILAQDSSHHYRSVFRKYDMQKQVTVAVDVDELEIPGAPPGFQVQKLSRDEQEKVDDAVKVMVGYILEGLEKGSNETEK